MRKIVSPASIRMPLRIGRRRRQRSGIRGRRTDHSRIDSARQSNTGPGISHQTITEVHPHERPCGRRDVDVPRQDRPPASVGPDASVHSQRRGKNQDAGERLRGLLDATNPGRTRTNGLNPSEVGPAVAPKSPSNRPRLKGRPSGKVTREIRSPPLSSPKTTFGRHDTRPPNPASAASNWPDRDDAPARQARSGQILAERARRSV